MIKIEQAEKNHATLIADFQIKMAFESETLVLDKKIISKGVNAVFNAPSKGQYFVAKTEQNKIVASLLITYEWSDWRNTWMWWIQSVFVLPEYRRQGIFQLMYNHIKKLVLLDDNIGGIRLYVEKENLNAQKTYNAVGMNGEHYQLFEWLK